MTHSDTTFEQSSIAPIADGQNIGRTAATLVTIGALGIVATSVYYVLAGPLAAAPGAAASSYEAVQAATAQGAAWMRAASMFGLPSDILAAVGSVMMAVTRQGRGAALAAAGWVTLGMASLLFVLVDGMVGQVLPLVAALPDSAAAYAGSRALFEVLFGVGTWAVGVGALAISWHAHWPEYGKRALLWLMRLAGALSLASGSAFILGSPAGRLVGLSVAIFSVALVGVGIAAMRENSKA